MEAAIEARHSLPTRGVCGALGLPPASLYRRLAGRAEVFPLKSPPKAPGRPHPRALCPKERKAVLEELHSERFADLAPPQVYAQLLDEGRYLCSQRTMYRILQANGQVRERRRQASHPKREPPELVATAPGQVWTWDITHLRTTEKGRTLKLYVCMDLFSRFVVGWYLSASESAAQARHFFETLAGRHGIDKDELVLHADNGGPMRGRPLADLLESLGIERSHSRPRTSNDNPFSESQFKTMKYRPTYPKRFGSEAEAREWCREFFHWYNNEHRHEALALLTPSDVHTGAVHDKLRVRAGALDAAYEMTPNRFVKGKPTPKRPPTTVAINPPKPPRSAAPTGATQLQEVAK
jgi:putative transposase